MKHILIPTDFSDCANAATTAALEIAKKAEAEVCFIHFHKAQIAGGHAAMHGGTSMQSKHSSDQGSARNELDRLVRSAEQFDVQAKQLLVFDDGQERLDAYIRSFNIDFIVMGSHGASGLKEMFIGSNTQHVIRESPVPVLVIKKEVKMFGPKNIVFASSFEQEVKEVFGTIATFAALWNSKLHLLYVNMPFNFKETDQAIADMKGFTNGIPGTSINIYDAFNEERGIQKFAHEIGADLIAMTTHGRTGFMRMISPSIQKVL